MLVRASKRAAFSACNLSLTLREPNHKVPSKCPFDMENRNAHRQEQCKKDIVFCRLLRSFFPSKLMNV